MAKKSRRKKPETNPIQETVVASYLEDIGHVPAEITGEADPPANEPPRSAMLAQLRADTVNAQERTAHTIAELEAWAAELASTIAFLRARK